MEIEKQQEQKQQSQNSFMDKFKVYFITYLGIAMRSVVSLVVALIFIAILNLAFGVTSKTANFIIIMIFMIGITPFLSRIKIGERLGEWYLNMIIGKLNKLAGGKNV